MKRRSLPSWANNSPPPSSSASSTPSEMLIKSVVSEDRNYLSPFEMNKKRKMDEEEQVKASNDDSSNNSQVSSSSQQVAIDGSATSSSSSTTESVQSKQSETNFYSNLIKPNKELMNKYINFYTKCNRLIFLDCETTGFSKNDQVIELSAVEMINGVRTGLIFNSRIKLNENVTINEKAYEVHKIGEEELQSKPSSQFVYSNFIDFLNHDSSRSGGVDQQQQLLTTTGLVGHNITFDLRMIKQDITKYYLNNTTEQLPTILTDTSRHFCTMNFYKNLRKNTSYDLDSTLHYFGIAIDKKKQQHSNRQDKHGAFIDTELTLELFKSLKQYIELNIGQSIEEYKSNAATTTTTNSTPTPPTTVNNTLVGSSISSRTQESNNQNSTTTTTTSTASTNTTTSIDENYSIYHYVRDLFNQWF